MQFPPNIHSPSVGKVRIVFRRTLIVIIATIAFVVLLVSATPQGRAALNTLLFVTQVLPAVPIKLQELVTANPSRQEVRYPIADGEGIADLYMPGSGSSHSAVLLFLGVNPAGRDDERVVGLAESLARTGTIVMIPWSDSMTQKRIDIGEIDNLVNAFIYLRNLETVNPERVGMAGFCVGASLAAVAAQDARISSDVIFVNFFGGYFNAENLVKAIATESRFYGDEAQPWEPDRLSREVVSTHLIEGVPNGNERELLYKKFIDGTNVEIAIEKLSQEARAVYGLLDSPTLEEAESLLGQISSETRASLRLISPETELENLEAKVLIMHDREDPLVPSEESRRLADALETRSDVYYTEFSLFDHVDPTKPLSPPALAGEGFKLFMHMYNVMREL